MSALIIISICLVIAFVIFYYSRSNAKRKAIEEEKRKKDQEQARIHREQEARKREELARVKREEEAKKHAVEAENKRIFTAPMLSDYIPVDETPFSVETLLPKVTSNIYFIGCGARLSDFARGLLVARFKDLGKFFIDVAMLEGLTGEALRYWFPSNSYINGEPSDLYDKIMSGFPTGEKHMYALRYDSSNGFMSYDMYSPDANELNRRISSYCIYHAVGYQHPTDSFFTGESPFKTALAPLALPVTKERHHSSDIRFSITSDASDFDSGIRFRITGDSGYTGGSQSYRSRSRDIDSLLSSTQYAAPKPLPRKKTTDEQYNDDVKKMLQETLENIQKLQLNGVSLNLIQALIGKTTRLSEIRITKNYKIILTDFNNLEINLNPLQTTVYILFLNHPEGISFYDLPDHRKELMDIYGHITGRSDLEGIKQSIESLVDRFDGSISTQCSRIRKAFITVLSEDIAKNYYIDGKQGENKTIPIPRSYVRRDDMGSTAANFNTPVAAKGKEYMDLIEASNFRSFKDLSFLLRPLEDIEFRRGYVPDAFWCGTKEDRCLRLYACMDGSDNRYPVCEEGSGIQPYDDTMYLEGIYSKKQADLIPSVSEYVVAKGSLGIWEAYLLSISETVIPHLRESTAERRRYVFSHRDLVEVLGTGAADRFRSDNGITPVVEMSGDGTARITCCYASSTKNGLCREYIQAESSSRHVVFRSEKVEILSSF